MPQQNQTRLPLDSEATAEFIFLLIIIWMVAGPISGAILSTQTWISSIFTKGVYQVESTKNLAKRVLISTERIKALETKLAQQELELTTLRQQSHDTNKLRALLGLKKKTERKTIAAEVIARNPDNWFKQVVIDKGKADGVRINSAVITSDGVVGRVVSVSPDASVVRLLTDPEEKLGVVISKIGLSGILNGDFQKPAKIDFVPVGTNVDVGDKIVCFGKGGTFPENHPVGTVCGVRRDGGGASLQIEVKLNENCYDLSQVLVLPPTE
ncbi:MAG TPA: rod shape-determining protein MreC [Chroococcales cyanobacterium]